MRTTITSTTQTSEEAFFNERFKEVKIKHKQKIEILFHKYRGEKLTRRQWYAKLKKLGCNDIPFAGFKSRVTGLIRDNKIRKSGISCEGGRNVETLSYGASSFGRSYTMLELIEIEMRKIVDKNTVETIIKNTLTIYKNQQKHENGLLI
jgi:hypothetical protein